MSSALDDFGRQLAVASRRCYESHDAQITELSPLIPAAPAPAHGQGHGSRRQRGLSGRLRRVRGRRRALNSPGKIGLAALVIAGGASIAAAYAVLAGSGSQRVVGFDCVLGHMSSADGVLVTGSPLIDCAAVWPSATGGRQAAPKLAVWIPVGDQRMAAVVQPAGWGAPSGGDTRWQRAPAGWTVNLPMAELTDQLDDLSAPFATGPTNSCSYIDADIEAVRQLFAADHLANWKIAASARTGTTVSHVSRTIGGCHTTIASVDEDRDRTVDLIQFDQGQSAGVTQTVGTPTTSIQTAGTPASSGTTFEQTLSITGLRVERRLKALEASVNSTLNNRCESVAVASALWRRRAAAAGFSVATLRYWRMLNAASPADSAASRREVLRLVDGAYTLYTQPASQHTGRCAHALVSILGGGGIQVYIARLLP